MASTLFENCGPIHQTFRDAQQHWHNTPIKEKFSPNNAWYGRLPEKEFPKNSGSTARGFRLGAMSAPRNLNWRKLHLEMCNNNGCSVAPEHIGMPGSDEYTYCINRAEAITDWLCLDGLVGYHNAVEEIVHIEEQLRRINRFYHEQFARAAYLDHADNHWAGILPPIDAGRDYCVNEDCTKILQMCGPDALYNAAWCFEAFEDGQLNERRVRVALPWNELYRIAPLSMDMLRHALQQVDAIDKAWNLYDRGTPGDSSSDAMGGDYRHDFMEIVLPDLKTRNNLQTERAIAEKVPGTDTSSTELDPQLGGKFEIEQFMFRYDDDLMRYAPLPPHLQPQADQFDAENKATWAILEMVPKTIEQPMARGIGHKPNPDWQIAPFGFATNFVRAAGCLEMLTFPSSYSTAKKRPDHLTESEVTWMSPPWQCNLKGNMGFWMFQHNVGYHPRRTELAHSWLIRLDNRIHLMEIACDLMVKRCEPSYTTECEQYHCYDTAGVEFVGSTPPGGGPARTRVTAGQINVPVK